MLDTGYWLLVTRHSALMDAGCSPLGFVFCDLGFGYLTLELDPSSVSLIRMTVSVILREFKRVKNLIDYHVGRVAVASSQ
jgi:hypothetical protein